MSFQILVVEDMVDIRSIVVQQLRDRLDAIQKDWWFGGNGHLASHEIDFIVTPLSSSDLKKLVDTANKPSALKKALGDLLQKYHQPEAILLDLALTADETERLETAGGRDLAGKLDVVEALHQTTGFRVLRQLSTFDRLEAPIPLVTTLARNPRVSHACLEAGAFSVIVKPVESKEMALWWDFATNPAARKKATTKQTAEADAVAPGIANYVQQLACETLKTVREAALRRSIGHAPYPVPFWTAHQRGELNARAIRDTNLLLMDVRGFSRLVALGVDRPEYVFDLMNIIWEVVLERLAAFDAEVNNFIGDAALVFRGVYARDGGTDNVLLVETLECARSLCEAFAIGGVVRKRLEEAINTRYRNILTARKNTDLMLEHVRTPSLGLRIVIADPDEKEGLYGIVGTSRRWQHTILSRFMNALARTESAVGRWEKDRLVDVAPAHCFMLWDSARSLPQASGVAFETSDVFLKGKLEPIRDVPDDLSVLRVAWNSRGARSRVRRASVGAAV